MIRNDQYLFNMGGVLLPVAPDKMTIKVSNKNETLTLINDGEINLLKQAGLSDISFSFLLPAQEYPFASYLGDFIPPETFLSEIEALKQGRKPFHFQVLRSSGRMPATFLSSFLVSLEDYEITEDAGQYGGDVLVSVKLRQYRTYGTKTVTISTAGTATVSTTGTRSTSGKTETGTYTVQEGDTLWGIARQLLGDGDRYQEILDANLEVLDKAAQANGKASSANGYWLYAGTVLTIPN